MSGALSPVHWLIIIGVLVVLFGAKKLPDAARGVGQSLRIFKAEFSAAHDDEPAGSRAGQPTGRDDQSDAGPGVRGAKSAGRSSEQLAAGASPANPSGGSTSVRPIDEQDRPEPTASAPAASAANVVKDAGQAGAGVTSPNGSSSAHHHGEG